MKRIVMEVHPQEKELLETLRNDIIFGTMTIKVENGIPIRGDANKTYDFRRIVAEKKNGTEG